MTLSEWQWKTKDNLIKRLLLHLHFVPAHRNDEPERHSEQREESFSEAFKMKRAAVSGVTCLCWCVVVVGPDL